MSETLIKNGTLVTMNPKREIITADVFIRDGRIVSIGKSSGVDSLITPENDCKIIDAKGCWVLPGFIQTHVHLCQTGLRNQAEDLELLDWLKKKVWPYEASHTKDTLFQAAKLGISELLSGGTTTLLDMGTVHHQDEIFKAAQELGIRLYGGKAMMDAGDDIPEGLKESTEQSLDETQRLIETWHQKENGRLNYALAPRFALSCSEKLLKACADISAKRNLLIHTHASENKSECKAVENQKGKRTIEYLNDMGLCNVRSCFAHCVWPDEKEINILAETKTNVCHCPTSNLKLASGIAPVPEMLKQNINVSLGADGAPCNNNLNMFNEMRLSGLIQKPRLGVAALGAQKIVEMATLNGAQALGIESEVGSIEINKKADLLVIDPNQAHSQPQGDIYTTLVYSCTPKNIKNVLIDGKVLPQLN